VERPERRVEEEDRAIADDAEPLRHRCARIEQPEEDLAVRGALAVEALQATSPGPPLLRRKPVFMHDAEAEPLVDLRLARGEEERPVSPLAPRERLLHERAAVAAAAVVRVRDDRVDPADEHRLSRDDQVHLEDADVGQHALALADEEGRGLLPAHPPAAGALGPRAHARPRVLVELVDAGEEGGVLGVVAPHRTVRRRSRSI
jgi:hypothetical protein